MFRLAVKRRVAILFLAFCMSVLLFQNCGRSSTSNQSADSLVATEIDDKNYYIIESGYTCKASTTGDTVPSYKDKLIVRSTEIVHIGDRCNDNIQFYPRDSGAFVFSEDQNQIQFEGQLFQYLDSEPVFKND